MADLDITFAPATIFGNSYTELRTWYLARLRRLAVETQKKSLTPSALVQADKALIQEMLAYKRTEEFFSLSDTELDTRRKILVAAPAAAAVFIAAITGYLHGVWVALAVLAPAFLFVVASFIDRAVVRKHFTTLGAQIVKRLDKQVTADPADEQSIFSGVEKRVSALFDALDESKQREAAIADFAPHVICCLSSDGKIRAANLSSTHCWGYRPEDLAGRPIQALIVAEDWELMGPEFSHPAQGEKVIELRITKRDGTIADMRWYLEWSKSSDMIFCVIEDISAAKQLERLRKEYVAIVSHELRTPLTAIAGWLTLMKEQFQAELPDRAKDILRKTQDQSKRMLDLVNDILDIERLEAGQMPMQIEAVEIASVAASAIDTLGTIASDAKVNLEVEPTEALASVDRVRTLQVLINLLANAIKFSPQGTTVKISAKQSAGQVEVRVTDQGRGIPAAMKDGVFERFRQVYGEDATKKKGSGLGLAICKHIVQQLGGTIGVDSTEGQGSSFWFRVPSAGARFSTVREQPKE